MNKGGILQTPEFFLDKGFFAESLIGSHILLAVPFEGGIAFGMRFDSRRNKPMQWVKPVTPQVIMAGWGEYADFLTVFQRLNDMAQSMTEFVGENYVSLPWVYKIASPFMKEKFESSVPFSLDILLADALSRQLCLVDLQGNVMLLEHFGILGGYHYMKKMPGEDISQEEMKKLLVFPRKDAIKYFNRELEKETISDKEKAIKILTQALFRFDPISKKETFEIVTYQDHVFTSHIIERTKTKKTK